MSATAIIDEMRLLKDATVRRLKEVAAAFFIPQVSSHAIFL
jgi:hypothetical protein